MKNKITVINGIPLKDLPSKPDMVYYLEGFYHRHGEKGLRWLARSLSHEVLAVLFLRAFDYDNRHPEAPPSELKEVCHGKE